jgi:hypothetical protein
MAPDNALTSNPKAYCLAKPGQVYAIYLLEGGSADLNVAPGIYSVQWYNPRAGGELLRGSIKQITGPGAQSIGQPPKENDKDWAVLVRKTTPQIGKQAAEIRQNLKKLNASFGDFGLTWEVLGRHLRNAHNQYDEGQKKLDRFGLQLGQIQQETEETAES